MLSIKDINNKQFEKASRGYKTEEVDSFLREVSSSFSKFSRDKTESEEKINKLVDIINEYRDDEDSIKSAILIAQKQGKLIIQNAELEAGNIITKATSSAEETLFKTRADYAREIEKLDGLKKEVSLFKSKLSELYNRQLRLIMEIPDFDEGETAEIEASEPITNSNDDILEQEIEQEVPEQQENQFNNENETVKQNQTRFGDLRFGNNQNK